MNRVTVFCDWCGAERQRYRSHVKTRNFCSRACVNAFASKTLNPEHYAELKDLSGVSQHMKALNTELNPHRMTPEVRAKLRAARLGTGNGKTYEKTAGKHTHRTAAEALLGRELQPGETVHHINRKKRDNRPENLQVFPSQAEHAAWHQSHDAKREVIR